MWNKYLSTHQLSITLFYLSTHVPVKLSHHNIEACKGWFNNYVMQWWHPLVWEKIMVGLWLCWARGGWWGKRLCIMVFWTMLLRMPLQPRGNILIAANITFFEDSLGQYKKNFQYIHQQVLDKGVFGLKILLFTRSRIT